MILLSLFHKQPQGGKILMKGLPQDWPRPQSPSGETYLLQREVLALFLKTEKGLEPSGPCMHPKENCELD